MTKRNHILSIDINNLSGIKIPEKETIENWLNFSLTLINHDILKKNSNLELSIRVVNELEMTNLNYKFRNKDRMTNVLSFPSKMNETLSMSLMYPYHLGDIIVCALVLDEELKIQAKNINAHWCHIIVHGFLHLFDYDHLHDDEASKMEELERVICLKLGFNDPYK